MATTKKETNDNDVIARLADKGEQAISRIGDLPGGQRALKAFNDLRLRVDELNKRVRGIDDLEKRVAKLEKDVAALRRAQKPASEKAPTRKASS
jgi:outer membrane murein-binding lipoprotein Lpp